MYLNTTAKLKSSAIIVYNISILYLQVKQMVDELMEKLPDEFNMTEIMGKVEERTPYVIVAFQECQRMNSLTGLMKRSLKELDLGLKVYNNPYNTHMKYNTYTHTHIKYIDYNTSVQFTLQGELTITSDMEELENALFLDQVPDIWSLRAYPSLLGLTAWFADLLLRIKELEVWSSDFVVLDNY